MITGFSNLIVALMIVQGVTTARAGDEAREVPEPFAPFEYLVGTWKGSGVPTANRVRGWNETHAWAWRFEKGNPIGMSVSMTGDKVLTEAKLSFDAVSKAYRLEGTDPNKKAIAFAGAYDRSTKRLTLDREGQASDGSKEQITLYPNSNLVRYSVVVSRKEAGAPQYKKTIEVGLTKEGESFAAGSSTTDLPKCIVTGGSATMSVTFEGKSYPLCCSGCKAEFDENPAKYVKKASMRASSGAKSPLAPSSSVGKDDGTFDEPKSRRETTASTGSMKSEEKSTPKKDEPKKSAAPSATDKAMSLLKLGQSLEKGGKLTAALRYYRQILKDYPKTPAAKTAGERVKALESD